MKKENNDNKFLIIWSVCIVVLLVISLFGDNINIINEIKAHFGGVTGTLTPSYQVIYSSNWPDITIENEIEEHQEKNIYMILDNMFEVPVGYEFVEWNTKSDGTGLGYVGSDVISLKDNLELYAQWALVSNKIDYGDVNQNGEIDNDDYLLIENSVKDTNTLTEQGLLNADVNIDGKVDLVDADIIKQVCLGNNKYVGYLPNNPILIYDIYEGNIDVGTGDTNDGNDKETGGDNTSLGQGTGNGSTGIGSGNSGSGHGNNYSSNSGTGNDNSSENSSDNESSSLNEENENNNESILEIYEFRFMNGNMEFAKTTCEVSNGKCELLLPNNNPVRSKHTFKGWSLEEGCSTGNGIIEPMIVDKENTYYACFVEDGSEERNRSYVLIIVFAICALSLRLIWYLVSKFRNENNKENSE